MQRAIVMCGMGWHGLLNMQRFRQRAAHLRVVILNALATLPHPNIRIFKCICLMAQVSLLGGIVGEPLRWRSELV